jgi:hypothetical protein
MSPYGAGPYFERNVSEFSMWPITVMVDAPSSGSSYSTFEQRVEKSRSDEKHNYSLHSSQIRDVPD